MSGGNESWFRLELLTSSSEGLLGSLWGMGALGVEVQDRETFMEDGSIPPVPEGRVRVIAFFDEEPAWEALVAGSDAHAVVSAAAYDDRSWETAWKEFFKPLALSRRSMVGPPWESFEAPAGGVKIVIEPGMAFGTGTHETTRVCGAILDQLIADTSPRSLLDVGCGSGILSMLACGLGVSHVDGVDVDEVAVEVARENLRVNGFEDRIDLSTRSLAELGRYEVVVANILAHILLNLREALLACVDEAGALVLSGVTTDQADEFLTAFTAPGFVLERREELGEWAAFVLRRSD